MSVFRRVVPVRFGHVDPAGIVYFPRVHDYLHEVFEDLWYHHVGAKYHELLMERRIGFPAVHSEVHFHSPLRFGDRPEVSVTCFRLGRSSIGLHYEFRVGERLCVDARVTAVCIDLRTMESIPLDEEFRARFEEILE